MKFLDMARRSLKEKKFVEALELARKGEHAVNKLISNYEGAKEELQLITQAVSRASKIGVDTTHISDLMKQAKAAFDAKDYRKATELISKCRETIEGAMHERTTQIIEVSEGILSIGEKTGSDVKKAREYINQASVAIKENDYEKAIELANKSKEVAGGDIKEGIYTEIKVFANVVNSIEEGEERNSCVKLLTSAKKVLEQQNYEEAYGYIIECQNIIEVYAKASIEVAQVTIATLGEMKSETSEFEKLLSKSKSFIEKQEYSEALSISKKIVQDVNEQQEEIVTDLCSILNDNIQQAKDVGMDITEQNNRLVAAKEAIGKKFFKKAYIVLTQSKDETISFLEQHKKLSEEIRTVGSQIEEAMRNGVDMSDPMKKLDIAEKTLKAGDFNAVSGMIGEIKNDVEQFTTTHSIQEKISISKECIGIAKGLGVNASDAELQLKKTVIYLNNGQFENALDSANKTVEKAEELCSAKISEMLSNAYSMIIEAKKIGLDVLTVEVLYQKAEEALELRKYDKAARYAAQSLDEIEEIRSCR
jgi:tetratricopeptide (TPR) repeat protein